MLLQSALFHSLSWMNTIPLYIRHTTFLKGRKQENKGSKQAAASHSPRIQESLKINSLGKVKWMMWVRWRVLYLVSSLLLTGMCCSKSWPLRCVVGGGGALFLISSWPPVLLWTKTKDLGQSEPPTVPTAVSWALDWGHSLAWPLSVRKKYPNTDTSASPTCWFHKHIQLLPRKVGALDNHFTATGLVKWSNFLIFTFKCKIASPEWQPFKKSSSCRPLKKVLILKYIRASILI